MNKKHKGSFFKSALCWAWLPIFILFFCLRLPSLFEPFVYGDEGIYLALGQAKRAGLTFYRDIHDNKPPLLYLIAAVSPTFFIYRLIYFLFSLGGFFIFRRLIRTLYPKNRLAQTISLAVFAVLASIPLFEGQIANAENYLIYFSTAAFLLLARSASSNTYFFAGVLFSLSTLFKVPGGFDFAAAGIIFFLLQPEKLSSILAFWKKKKFWFFVVGFIAPLALTILYYYQAGAGPAFVKAALAQNIPYLSSWNQEKTAEFQLPVSMMVRSLIVILPTLGLFLTRRQPKTTLAVKVSLVWFACALFAALLSSRPYPHYLLQAVPAIAISAGLIVARPELFRSLPIIFILCVWLAFEKYHYYGYPIWTYYQNFWQRATSQITQREYLGFWGNWALDLPEIGRYLHTHTTPSEKIFIWSDQPAIYPISNRLPVGKFTAAYHVKTFDPNYAETMKALQQKIPVFILVDQAEKNTLGPIEPWLNNHYTYTTTIGEIDFYRYLSPIPSL